MTGFLNVLDTLVQSAATAPQLRIGELGYLGESGQAQIRQLGCGPELTLADSSIPARFAAMAQAHPDQCALRFGEQHTSYQQLAVWSDQIAAGLRSSLQPGDRVGLAMQKSDTLVASVLAILKLGCAYVPLDASYPADRVRYFAQNGAVTCVVADEVSQAALQQIGLTDLRYLNPEQCGREPGTVMLPPVAADALAYIIHTSGSTGLPKGVMIEHYSVVRLAEATALALDYGPGTVGALNASMNFDASVIEIFSMLLNGHTLVIVPEATRKSPALLHQELNTQGVTHVVLSPVMLQNLPKESLPSLQLMGFGGDTLDEQTAAWWSRQTRLFSLYGPTETTVMASCGQIVPEGNSRIIGKPLAGYRIYLLNRDKQPVPLGAVGEICIGGRGLARGYLNRDEQTLERFVLDPFGGSPYALMYLTGDLGRFLPDGTIEFFGRNDAQVKIRGFRIELGEIENRLATFPGIRHVVCATKGEGDNRYLAAYYVADAELDEEAIRQHVAGFLPDYMVPSFFVRLEQLPASPSGKVDRKALPAISGKSSTNPPRPGLEQQLATIWEQILRFRGIGRDESFFRVGGNSLLAVRMQVEVQKQLGLQFTMADFYGAPTLAALASRQSMDYIQMAIRDSQAPMPVLEPATDLAHLPPQCVLLTGASGFLGIYLLAELLAKTRQVVCLQRCHDESHGLTLLRQQADKAGLTLEWERVRIVRGDLAEPDLGLTPAIRQQLAGELDAIVHCGAFVHHLHNYQTMKAANVDSTISLLQLALESRRKSFCFVSTLSLASILAGVNAAPEAIVENLPQVDSGYLLTKWTAEQWVARFARDYGLNAVIARPGNITGSSDSGFSNYEHNHFWLFNQGCLQLGAFPQIQAEVEMTPVDRLAFAITALALALAPRQGLAVRNLSNPQSMSQSEFFGALSTLGFDIHGEEAKRWQLRLNDLDEQNGLSQIKEFYTGELDGPSFPIEQRETLAELARLDASLAVDYGRLLPLYVAYLRQVGFLA